MNQQNITNYDENDIQVLEGLEAVRKRPGMYIGSTGASGLHHLVYEIVDNSIDEALAGYCNEIKVEILPGDVIRVSDNGRGIPVGIHPKEKISAATVVYTVLHAGGKFGGGGYKVSGGLHGVGASAVNALSEWLELTVYDGENIWFQRFQRGSYSEPLKKIGETDKTGTSVMFKADDEIFETTVYSYDVCQIWNIRNHTVYHTDDSSVKFNNPKIFRKDLYAMIQVFFCCSFTFRKADVFKFRNHFQILQNSVAYYDFIIHISRISGFSVKE